MGDKSQISTYAPLFNYLERNGVDLSGSGSAERGLSLASALEFLGLLEDRNVQLLGIEPWRKDGAKYRCDTLSVWVPDGDAQTVEEARRYLHRLELQDQDIVTVQYR